MDFEFTPEQESFRRKVREWIGANLPKDLCVDDAQDERIAPNRAVFERRRAWQAKLHSAGYAGLSWPIQYGGHAASLIEQVIWDEEYSRARAPVLPGYFGLGLCGPTLMQWGSEEQKKRFLPRILGADDIWCQGYSEPGAGSDLAGLQTRGSELNFHCQLDTEGLVLYDELSDLPLGYGVSFDAGEELCNIAAAFVARFGDSREEQAICRAAAERIAADYARLTGGAR